MNTLPALLRAPELPTLAAVQAQLQGLEPQDQYLLIRTLGRKQQLRLYDLCADSPPLTRDDFIPAGTPVGTAVEHFGWNTLPLLKRWRTFAKPMCALPAETEIAGYNDSSTRWLLGPGYFICRPTDAEHADRGAWVVDYLRVPAGDVPAGWPDIKPNEEGLQRFVYGGTRDYMRKVCDGVCIGMPYKGDKRMAFPFALVRT
ncbi:MAG: hypothetical protein ACJATT_005216 [Myxococcota bacterium]|jgi:hypothetical protein